MQDRKAPYKSCWESFLIYNEFDREEVKLIRVSDVVPTNQGQRGQTRAPATQVWVTFSATERVVSQIQAEGYRVNHPSAVDEKPMCKVTSNVSRDGVKLLKDLSTATIEGLYTYRG